MSRFTFKFITAIFGIFVGLLMFGSVNAEDQSDFIIESITFDSNTRKATVRLKNIGDAAIQAPSPVNAFIRYGWKDSSGRQIGGTYDSAILSSLKIGGSFASGEFADYKPGTAVPANAKTFFAELADPGNAITESDETNNSKSEPLPPIPDLVIESIAFDPNRRYPIITVKNQGDAATGVPNARIDYVWLNTEGVASEGYSASMGSSYMRAGQSYQLDLFGEQPVFTSADIGKKLPVADSVKIRVRLDITNEVQESNEDNNTLEVNVPAADADNLTYPVAELGNCQNREACQAYCEAPENTEACTAFGLNSGLLSEEEAEAAEELDEINENNPGPGNCTTKENCAEFCEAPANIEACLNYAEQNNWMSADDLSKARKVVGVLQGGGATPGSCNTPSGCKTYCSDNTHAIECVAFGKTAGLLTAEEAAEAEKVAPLMQSGQMPGGKTNREELEAYCKTNREECDKFFEQAGVKKGTPSEGEGPKGGPEEGQKETPPSIFEGKEGGGPGGCKTKAECDTYCDAHPGECDQAVVGAGGEVKEATAVCSTKEECEVLCDDPANKEAEVCKSGTIIIKEESPESAGPAKGLGEDPLEKLRSDIQEVISQSQSQDCVKQILGEEVFTKFVIEGGIPEKAISREALQPCFEEAKRAVEQQEMLKMQKKPDDPDMVNPPPSGKISTFLASIINILKWFSR